MHPQAQDLKSFSNPEFNRGAGKLKQVMWYICNSLFFKSGFPFSACKVFALRMFGAKVGRGVLIKPGVNIKFPWKLEIGNYVWIGENVWIDNLDQVSIGNNVCISQGAMLLCGNHNYKKASFDLFTQPIALKDGVWICAKSIVGPGVTCHENAILLPQSMANADLASNLTYSGNPAIKKSDRFS